MDYYRSEVTVSPLEPLLDQLDAAEAEPASNLAIPTIEQFLDEEDILRECRGDNKRLISYLCRPEIVRALVTHCVNSPEIVAANKSAKSPTTESDGGEKSAAAEREESQTENKSDNLDSASKDQDVEELKATDVDAAEEVRDLDDYDSEEETDKQAEATNTDIYKYTYVASELLSADIRELCDVVVGDAEVMDILFACLENSPAGELNQVVATNFSKVLVSLLKTRNTETVAQMKRRGRSVTDGIIKHICLGPISDLLVHLLDAPENERSYTQTIHPPSEGALSLLAEADVLNGLANCFVQASNPAVQSPPSAGEAESAAKRRQREETMSNVTASITGLTERILQLPPLGVTIPNKLSPYHTPKAMSRLLDAGLYAAGVLKEPMVEPVSEPGTANAIATLTTDVIVSGNNSALLHSLGLIATLMTTKSNLWESERLDCLDSDRAGSASSNGGLNGDEPVDETSGAIDDEPGEDNLMDHGDINAPGCLLRPKISGETIISTTFLESELVVRFQRLSQMFGSNEEDETSKLPLGSLRLKLAEFFTACMKKASRSTVDHIIELEVPKKLLDLFLRYEWSSMLHGVVSSSIVSALEAGASGSPARVAWFDAKIISWLLGAWTNNEQKEAGEESFRAGYMGHLIKIGAALRNYLEDTPKDKVAALVDEESVKLFHKFAEERLAPARRIEVTPLCDNDSEESEPEIVDDPRDLLDMGVGEVIEGLTQGDTNIAIERFSKFLLHKSNIEDYEDEEIHPVEVGDLSHFGPDDDDIEEVTDPRNRIDVDHDLPPEMQEQIYRGSSADKRPKVSSESTSALKIITESNGIVELRDDEEDDGTYNSFIATPADSARAAEIERLTTGFNDSVQIVEPLSVVEDADDVIVPIPSPSLEVDAAVTEIEEPRPLTPAVLAEKHNVSSLKNNTVVDHDDSSDEDLGDWVAFDADELTSKAKSSTSDVTSTVSTKTAAAEPESTSR